MPLPETVIMDNRQKIYIAICIDRHIDETVRVFSTFEKAKDFCMAFIPPNYEREEHTTDGWLYHATYGSEGDSVRVEEGFIDP